MFSERGLTEFKRTYDLATPDKARFFHEADAVFLPGFGPLAITPFNPDAACLQRDDGSAAVSVADDRIDVHVAAGQNVFVGGPGGEELATRAFVDRRYNTHVHSTPAGLSGPPVEASPAGSRGRSHGKAQSGVIPCL